MVPGEVLAGTGVLVGGTGRGVSVGWTAVGFGVAVGSGGVGGRGAKEGRRAGAA